MKGVKYAMKYFKLSQNSSIDKVYYKLLKN